jgi:hypothetical protein
VIWDFVGEAIPPPLMRDLEALDPRLREGPLRGRLGDLLSESEVEATRARLLRLLSTGRYPEPGPGRPYPWPVV